MTTKLSKSDPDYYSTISNMRRKKSGGKTFMDVKVAKDAQTKSVQSRLRNARKRTKDKKDN